MPRTSGFLKLFIFLAFTLGPYIGFSQISYGGKPISMKYQQLKKQLPYVTLETPDTVKLQREDKQAKARGLKAKRIGITLPRNITMKSHGVWEPVAQKGKIWRLGIEIPGARALSLYYEQFRLPQGAELFIYDDAKNFIKGAFNHMNNKDGGAFATVPIPGDKLIIEYFQPSGVSKQPEFHINGVMFAYKGFSFKNTTGFGDSGDCEVNVNCPEGIDWQDEKKGAVKIITNVRGTNYLCTGSLVNNTEYDFAPLLLTANHCAKNPSNQYSTADNLEQWSFFFNYETDSAICQNPFLEPLAQTMVGSEELAKSGEEGADELGSDFFLLRLSEDVPPDYEPYFNGWDASGSASNSGVVIHHPQGDIKKISTYEQRTSTISWDGSNPTHWSARWSETETGYGVTEPGSSGAPLFNEEGLIIGMLTGGGASCDNPTSPDYFGKFSYSWESNGTTADKQLSPWLDPGNTGVVTLDGSKITYEIAVAQFTTDTTTIPVESEIDFMDRSKGNPTSWQWTFTGAEPSSSTEQNPQNIRYNHFGDFEVKLVVENENNTSTTIDTIHVKPVVYPNPLETGEQLTIFLGEHEPMDIDIRLMNSLGQLVIQKNLPDHTENHIKLSLVTLKRSVYFLEVRNASSNSLHKIILTNEK